MNPAGGKLPAGHVQFVYRPAHDLAQRDAGMRPSAHLFRVDGLVPVELPLVARPMGSDAFLLTPTSSMVPAGAKLELRSDDIGCESDQPLLATFEITPAAETPKTLGTISAHMVHAPLRVAVSTGSCDELTDTVYADITLTLSTEAQPFDALIARQVLVDGEPNVGLPGTPVHALCNPRMGFGDSSQSISANQHKVSVRGTLVDGTVLETPSIDADFTCPVAVGDAGAMDASRPLVVPDAAWKHDVDIRDARVPSKPDASVPRGGDDTVERVVDEDHGCALASRDGAGGLWLALAALVLRRKR